MDEITVDEMYAAALEVVDYIGLHNDEERQEIAKLWLRKVRDGTYRSFEAIQAQREHDAAYHGWSGA